MVTETWYRQESDVLHLPGYQSFFLNRPSRRGGGVLQLVSNEFSCTLIPEFSTITPDYEVLSLQYKKYVFVVVYRPPDGNIDNFISFFESILSFVCLNDMNLSVGGDFNVNLLQSTSQSQAVQLLLHSFYCRNVITEPTRESCI